jgi:hypothetical protein
VLGGGMAMGLYFRVSNWLKFRLRNLKGSSLKMCQGWAEKKVNSF